MCRRLASLFLPVLVAACAVQEVGFVPLDQVHEVDGYWVTGERPCEFEQVVDCETAIALVAAEGGPAVVRASHAGRPAYWRNEAGEIAPGPQLGGLALPQFIVLDLSDGSHRVVSLQCGPRPVEASSQMERVCTPFEYPAYRTDPLPAAGQ